MATVSASDAPTSVVVESPDSASARTVALPGCHGHDMSVQWTGSKLGWVTQNWQVKQFWMVCSLFSEEVVQAVMSVRSASAAGVLPGGPFLAGSIAKAMIHASAVQGPKGSLAREIPQVKSLWMVLTDKRLAFVRLKLVSAKKDPAAGRPRATSKREPLVVWESPRDAVRGFEKEPGFWTMRVSFTDESSAVFYAARPREIVQFAAALGGV
jgi:hypothetical protein